VETTSIMASDSVADAAERLYDAQRLSTPCSPVRDLLGATDIVAAYRVQSQIVARFVGDGRRLAGRKIGLTSSAVQRQLGVNQPDFGVLFADMDCSSGTPIDMHRLLQPRIEAEVAFLLVQDIVEHVSATTVHSCVGRVAAALEIVDSRILGWDISLADTIADNASSGLYVLGQNRAVDELPDLAKVRMTMVEDDRPVSDGKGSDCLGSPWKALAWLANTCREFDAPLRSGEVVLSGALGPMVPITAGARYTAHIDGLGSVSAEFAASSTREAMA